MRKIDEQVRETSGFQYKVYGERYGISWDNPQEISRGYFVKDFWFLKEIIKNISDRLEKIEAIIKANDYITINKTAEIQVLPKKADTKK